MSEVSLRGVRKQFGKVEIIKGVDLEIADGEFCVFVGPSGCGKSTLLRMIAGLEEISGGDLRIAGRDMTRVPPANRGVAMVFQSYALYPHMTVRQNISFGLEMAKMPRAEIDRRVTATAEMLQLAHLLDRKPSQLSGGQRQRVAIGRAIVREPDVFLFDEPLSNLDAELRVQMRVELSALHQRLGATMIYVTHDQVEAMTMADKIVVLNGGRIEQVGTPLELYHRPRNLFVAGFIGSPKMNFLGTELTLDHGRPLARLPGGVALPLPAAAQVRPGKATLGVRPEHLSIEAPGDVGVPGSVKLAEHLGAETLLYLELDGGQTVAVRAGGLTPARPGDQVAVGFSANACHLFDPDGRAVVNGALM